MTAQVTEYIAISTLFRERAIKKLIMPGLRLQARPARGRLYATDGGAYGADVYYGYIDMQSGRWYASSTATPEPVAALLARIALDGTAVMADVGKESGVCCYCGLRLDDPESVERGYGPVCARHHGLPHGNKHGF